MRKKKLKLGAILLLVLGLSNLNAQEVIPATGGNASGSGGTASYSVGQVVYTTSSGTNGSVANGVQQPFEISVVSGLPDTEGINLTLSAFPNPATDFLLLTVEGESDYQYTAMLYDITGKMVSSEKITTQETKIDLRQQLPATYFLKIVQPLHATSQEIKTFKIIKN
jgi:opacity protein-like surface antigen